MSINKKRNLLPLKKQLLLLMLWLIIGLSIITMVIARRYIQLQTATVKNTLQLYSSQLAASTNEMYEACKNISYNIAYDQIIQNYISDSKLQNTYENYISAYDQLTNAMNLSPYIIDISILSSLGNTISLTSSASTYQQYYDELEDTRFSFRSMGSLEINGTLCQVVALPIYQLSSGTSQFLGILFVSIDTDKFFVNSSQLLNDISTAPEIILTDSNDSLIYGDSYLYKELIPHSNHGNQFELQTDDSTFLVTSYMTEICSCNLYVLTNQNTYLLVTRNIMMMQIISLSAILLLTSLIILCMYQPLISSLNKLTLFMKDISNQPNLSNKRVLELSQGVFGSQEIQDITNAFNEMLIETNKLNHTIFNNYTKMYELEINSRKTEIAFLRSQVNPHFLYNTLTMICGMASANMQNEIIETASALSTMFRYSIKGTEMVPLREELKIVRSYLKIQTMRFENRFTIQYNLAEESLDWQIPKMTIQPLVENAIVHGLEPNPKQGKLLIGSGINPQKGYLAVWIYDTGIGMSEEKLEEVRSTIHNTQQLGRNNASDNYHAMDSKYHDSIGILNVNSRMVLYFGDEYSLIIDSEEGKGTNVQLRIPYTEKVQILEQEN